jgi:hypothetical protein
LTRPATAGSGRIGRRRRESRFHTARAGNGMLRARPARTGRRNARTHAGFGNHRLAGTDGSAINRLAGHRRGRRFRHSGSRRGRRSRHGRPRRGRQLRGQIGPRRNYGTCGGLTRERTLLLRLRCTRGGGHRPRRRR